MAMETSSSKGAKSVSSDKPQRGIYDPVYPLLKECLERNREQILRKTAGVTGVGIGYKVKGGEETDQLALVICVKEKLPEQQLASDDAIAKAIDGQVTDVRQLTLVEPPGHWGAEEPPVKEQEVATETPEALVKAATNLRGGDSIGGPSLGGTLGFFFKKDGKLGVTSNAHVFSPSQKYATVPTGGKKEDRIGTITKRYLPPSKTGETDGAFVTLDDQNGPSEYKLKDGTSVKGTGTANINDQVKYYGAASKGVVTGVVKLVDFDTGLFPSGYTFIKQILLDNSASSKPGTVGDSGALLVRTTDNKAVGVQMAVGTDKGKPFSVCNPIASFEKDLGITLVPTP